MGVIEGAMNLVFGGGRNVVKETAGVFWENAEAGAQREAAAQAAALAQFGAEFALPKKGLWDRFIDGLNRVPRPAMALGTLGLFVSAMVNPVWFAARMNGIALVPEPLWWLLGAIVSFYFGARHQVKSQEFQRSIATTVASTGAVVHNLDVLDALQSGAKSSTSDGPNPALDDW
ncbi:MAG TPA: carboxylesterase, partial [Maritimibacter sp.]|nr:carboxylesterase [Maritimibacter sp.]